MMPNFSLINMNGRLYDPILGRFLSPDNYVQIPNFSQSFNRYSYCLNNPLKYTDPDGEIVWWVAAIVVGGTLNAAFNADNIDNFGDFLKYFGVGAAAGLAGGYVGSLVSGALTAGGTIAANSIYGGLMIGGASGATGGFILGGGNSWLSNGNFSNILSDAFFGCAIGGLTGALIGGVTGAISAHNKGYDLWTGQPKHLSPQINFDTELMESVAPKIPVEESTRFSSLNMESNAPKLTPYQKGEIGVQKAIGEFIEEGGVVLQREVSINVDGVNIKPDFVGMKDGMIHIYEVKNGPHAGFTQNQKIAIPKLIEQHLPFTPYGRNASNVPAFKSLIIDNKPYTGNYKFVIKHYW